MLDRMGHFYNVLSNSLISIVTNSFLWFAVTFWAYLETRSVIATSIIGGSFMLLSALMGLFFGTYVDHHKKKRVMLVSSGITLIAFVLAGLLFMAVPRAELLTLAGPYFWLFVLLILAGAIAGNMRMIALSTTVTLLVPEDRRDKANGMAGVVNGLAFAITSVFSGLVIGFLGMEWALGISVGLTLLTVFHLLTINIPEKEVSRSEKGAQKKLDIKGTMRAISAVPGLLALIFFTTFNNFLGGVFMSLMDPYGLELMPVEAWGALWGVLSVGFIVGGLIVARKGLGKHPLRTLFLTNVAMWVVCILFPIHSSIIPLAIGMFVYMCLIPVIEAAEQTIIQGVVPFKRQGRVFGFAQSVESAASPVTAFLIGPIAQFWILPFMAESNFITSWFGQGAARGIALIFIVAGAIGLIVTLLAMASRSYKTLSAYKVKQNAESEQMIQEFHG